MYLKIFENFTIIIEYTIINYLLKKGANVVTNVYAGHSSLSLGPLLFHYYLKFDYNNELLKRKYHSELHSV